MIQQCEEKYTPAIHLPEATGRYSLSKVPVTLPLDREFIYGTAIRVGYTGKQLDDLAMYRLKVRRNRDLPVVTLNGFFVLQSGVFIDYEEWKRWQ